MIRSTFNRLNVSEKTISPFLYLLLRQIYSQVPLIFTENRAE